MTYLFCFYCTLAPTSHNTIGSSTTIVSVPFQKLQFQDSFQEHIAQSSLEIGPFLVVAFRAHVFQDVD